MVYGGLRVKKFRPPINSPKGRRKGLGGSDRALPLTSQEVKGLAGKASILNQPGLGAPLSGEDFIGDVHTDHGKDYLHQVKGHIPGKGKDFVYHSGMTNITPDPWPQRKRFRALADAWLEGAVGANMGAKRIELARLLGLGGQASLKQYYSGKQVPGRNLLQKMAQVLECGINELMDDPSAPPKGIDPNDWREADEDARTFANIMFHEAKDLSPEVRKAILDMVKAGRAMGQQRKANGE